VGAVSVLRRVTLPDRPGSLGALAIALGSVGADILSLDVLERGEGYAMDDIVVHVPQGTMPDTLITAAEQIDGVLVDSLQPFGGILDAHRDLELIDVISGAGERAPQLLVDEIPAALRVGWALVTESTSGGFRPVARGAAAPEWEGSEVPALVGVDRAVELDDDEVPAQ